MGGFLRLCVILVLIFNDRAVRCRILDQNAPPDVRQDKSNKEGDAKMNNSTSETVSKNNASDILPPQVKDSATANKTEEDSKEYPNDHCCSCADIVACLSSPGSDADHGVFSLEISSHNAVKVKIKTPDFLTADKSEVTTNTDGTKIVVRIEMADPEAAKAQPLSNITIIAETETCDLIVPSQNLGYSQQDPAYRLRYSTLRSPVVGFSMLTLALILVLGIWAYCRYRGKNRHNVEGAKYMELEMGDSTGGVDGNAVAADETNDKDGWDENWDEDWEDTEKASGSSSFRSLSSKGLAARRAAGKAD